MSSLVPLLIWTLSAGNLVGCNYFHSFHFSTIFCFISYICLFLSFFRYSICSGSSCSLPNSSNISCCMQISCHFQRAVDKCDCVIKYLSLIVSAKNKKEEKWMVVKISRNVRHLLQRKMKFIFSTCENSLSIFYINILLLQDFSHFPWKSNVCGWVSTVIHLKITMKLYITWNHSS